MEKLVSILIIALITTVTVCGQNVELSAKHQQKLAKVSDPYKRTLKHKKYYKKDSLKQSKAHIKEQIKKRGKQAVNDSLANILDTDQYKKIAKEATSLDSTKITNEAEKIGKQELSKEVGIDVVDITIDSTTTTADQARQKGKERALQEVKKNEEIGEYAEVLEGVQLDSLGSMSVDSLGTQGKELVIQKGEEYLKNTDEFKMLDGQDKDSPFGELTKQKEQLEQTQSQLKEAAAQDKFKKQMTSKAKDFIMQNTEQIQQVQSKMTDLKKKYSSVPNSNDLSTATKHKSLEGETFWKRLVLGGNFNLTKTNPVTLDLSPVIGYRINKLFEAGASLTYRTQFIASSSNITKDEAVYGQSLWTNHLFYKNYMGHLEGERMSTVSKINDINTRSWKESLMLGVGRKFKIAKWMEMQALVLFNLLYNPEDELYASPVVFRTGFRLIP